MNQAFTMGLDFGTNTVRALIVDTATGQEIGTAVSQYPHGSSGIILDQKDPNLARQHPADYIQSMKEAVAGALKQARSEEGFSPDKLVAIGVDATGSTPMPVDENGKPLALSSKFENNPAALAWLWKDHTAYREAEEITSLAKKERPQYLAKCGGTYSSEWYWSKLLHAKRTAADVFEAAFSWVELTDWIPALLTGNEAPSAVKRGICCAGHKAMFHAEWGGYPDEEFVGQLDKGLARIRRTLPDKAYSIADKAGELSKEWADCFGLESGIPVAAGALDAHLGAVGSGVRPGVLSKVMGTSGCDMMVAPLDQDLPDIPGLCGIVPESILPGFYGLEAGQAAVGDIYNWFVNQIQPRGPEAGSHEELTKAAEKLTAGESGLLALDWHNGNRTILVDQRLTGLMLGMTLHTSPGEIYRTLIEATAFGARAIVDRLDEYGVKVDRVVNCGGISVKNPLVMQIYADVLNRPMEVSKSEQTCALGSAMAAAVVAGVYKSFAEATEKMTALRGNKYLPDAKTSGIYERLYALYKKMHDSLGCPGHREELFLVMKELLAIRDETRK